jgi:thiol:disulfide interchange protein
MKSFALIILLILGSQICAAEMEQHDHLDVHLVSEVVSVNPAVPFYVGIYFDLEEHWHVYWKNPGDAGLQPKFEWDLPPGFKIGEIKWPYPEKIMVGGLANYGYEHEVLLIAEIIPPPALKINTLLDIGVHVEWLMCREACIPGEADLDISIPVNSTPAKPNDRWVQKFSDARDNLPIMRSDWQISASISDTLLLINLKNPEWYQPTFDKLTFFPESEDLIENAADQVLKITNAGYQLSVTLNQMRLTDPDSVSGVLVSEAGWRGANSEKALQFDVEITDLPRQVTTTFSDIGLALIFAFLGGIILNVMPCVLPVLSLKILGFVKQAGDDRKKVFHHGLIFTAGVVAAFLTLAILLIVLRAGGEELGWGFQLQSPGFIMILSTFLFLFGLNLFGVFEIGTSVMGVGQNLAGTGGWFGSFMSGVTATVVATPCTAPFMGSALGFALTQSNSVSLLIFASLGFGMAFPYLILSSVPKLLKFVPKPGQWMESLKQFMGFLLFATVIWLIWVFGIQTGIDSVVVFLGVLLGSGLSAWIIGRWTRLNLAKSRRLTARIIAIVILLTSIFLGLDNIAQDSVKNNQISQSGEIQWETYSFEKLQLSLGAGRPVFIDFTAAWCLSCQVNERLAFTSTEVAEKIRSLDMVMLKADWTNRDENITRALAGYGRNSVPLYVIHTEPDLTKKVILPEIISASILLDYLNEIGD